MQDEPPELGAEVAAALKVIAAALAARAAPDAAAVAKRETEERSGPDAKRMKHDDGGVG